MNYSLSVNNKFDKHPQLITVCKNGSNNVDGTVFTELKGWIDALDTLIISGWTTRGKRYSSLSAVDGFETGNTGSKADISVNIVNETANQAGNILFELTNCTKSGCANEIKTKCNSLSGGSYSSGKYYPVNVIINLHD